MSKASPFEKYLNSKFQYIHHTPGTFHCNVIKDFRNKTIILRDLMESFNQKILLGSQSRTPMRVEKPEFIYLFNKNLEMPPS